MITEDIIKNNEQIRTYITKADEALVALGYTEHSFAHVTKVARLSLIHIYLTFQVGNAAFSFITFFYSED